MADERFAERVPPQNVEAEMSTLGSILLEPECMNVVAQELTADDFYQTANKQIFRALLELYDRNSVLDVVVLKDELERRGLLAEVGGPEYLLQLAEAVPSAANVEHYARIVRERSVSRSLIQTSTEILRSAYTNDLDVATLLEEAEQKIFSLAHGRRTADGGDFREILQQAVARIESLHNRGDAIIGLSSGFADLDDRLSGMQPSQLIIIAGRPSMGKTSLALNIADHVAMSGTSVLIFSLEVATIQVAQNLLCSHARVDAQKVRRGQLDEDGWGNLIRAADELSKAPVFIDDSPGLSVLQLRAKARRLRAMHRVGLVIVDYMQLVTAPSAENRQQEISQISMGLKRMARELDVPVVALSQLNRVVDSREDHRPRMSDLRESGSIEQDADVVAFLYRPEYYDADRADLRGQAELIIAKQRNGPTGTVPLTFMPQCMRFASYSPEEYHG
ncbi:MAG: replicative DNA helicase [Planctomycetota bacterium]